MKNIYPRLVSREYYKTRLSSAVSMDFLDLKIVFTFDTEAARVYVTDDILQQLEMSVEELFDIAFDNLVEKGVQIISLSDLLSSFGFPEDLDGNVLPLYIYSSKELDNAAVTLYTNAICDFANAHNVDDVIVIPSSTNEVILLPSDNTPVNEEQLAEIIQDINSDVVSEENVLSDHPYYYSTKNHVWHWKN